MSLNTPEPVIPSERYVVTTVDGRTPSGVSDFVGAITVTVERNGSSHELTGTAGEVDGALRLYEKGIGGGGKDVRVWDVTQEADGTFSVMHGGPR
jgi:hypothetical protein